MPQQSKRQTRQLVFFWAIVLGALAVIFVVNRRVRDRGASLSEDGTELLRGALRRLAANPDTLSMTMGPGTQNERQLRHANASLVGRVDVLALGQSDADHMSQAFFGNGVRFYNGFISNSFFAYQYEVFEDVVEATGVPQLVLLDVSSGYMLQSGDEPAFDLPASDPLWWAGAPYRAGKAKNPAWYNDIDSLLSLQQTELTLRSLRPMLVAPANAAHSSEPDVDTGAPFLDVARTATSNVHRWLADGSRVYPGEVDGVLVPRGQPRVEVATGDRHFNAARLPVLEAMVSRLRNAGAEVVMYSPPLQPLVFADGTQTPLVLDAESDLRVVASRAGVDYCGLGMEAASVGCRPSDFYDELHISRQCDQMVIRKLASGCAAKSAALLRRLTAAVFTD